LVVDLGVGGVALDRLHPFAGAGLAGVGLAGGQQLAILGLDPIAVWSGVDQGTMVIHEGELGRQPGLEAGQGAAQDAIPQRGVGQLVRQDDPVDPEALAGGGQRRRAGPAGQPGPDLQPQGSPLGDLVGQVAAAQPDQLGAVQGPAA
jgi:hypothetical protein